jgi:hypothetical protein
VPDLLAQPRTMAEKMTVKRMRIAASFEDGGSPLAG